MTYYSVLEVTPTDDSWIPAYLGPAGEVIASHGGKYLARTTNHERVEGEGEDPALRVLLEWPSKEAAMAFMSDPKYVPHLEARTAGSVSHHVLISGQDDMA